MSFLVLFAFGFSALTLFTIRGRRTVLGERVLGDLTMLFDALRERADELRPNIATGELALLMAVFGRGCRPDWRVSIRTRVQAGDDDEHVLVRLRMWLVERQQQLRRGRQQLRRRWMWRMRKLVTASA